LPSPNSDPAQSIERENAGANDHDRLTAALAKLDERSRMILSRRWLADSKATLHELAAEYGVSAERIRQIEANAIGKLKKQLAAA
jgi:RNA polymerase sigma-32 factor